MAVYTFKCCDCDEDMPDSTIIIGGELPPGVDPTRLIKAVCTDCAEKMTEEELREKLGMNKPVTKSTDPYNPPVP